MKSRLVLVNISGFIIFGAVLIGMKERVSCSLVCSELEALDGLIDCMCCVLPIGFRP